ncbi:MAG: glycosyltransferase family A protein [Candidatus Liptonbacteria bacterium]|nr:glycosyltransferase family A protein [Candidatus Liptonbacteria bacterium]
MKLSFVIPAHNEEQYIGKCLDSISRAIGNDTDIEVIVVNNSSTDHTKEVVARFPKVKIVDEPNRGANYARQAGYLAAKSELIANVDADTMLTPGWIENALSAFSEKPDLVCLSGPFIYYDLPEQIKKLVRVFYAVGFLVYVINRFILRRASVIQGGNYVVRKSALAKIGGHNTTLTFYGDDADLARRLMKIGKIKFTFGFPIYSSGRRLAKEGMFTMGLRYGINYFWIILFNRPFTRQAREVRPAQENGKVAYMPENKAREAMIAAGVCAMLFSVIAGFTYLGYIFIQSGIVGATTFAKIKTETQKAGNTITTFSSEVKQKIEDKLKTQ